MLIMFLHLERVYYKPSLTSQQKNQQTTTIITKKTSGQTKEVFAVLRGKTIPETPNFHEQEASYSLRKIQSLH